MRAPNYALVLILLIISTAVTLWANSRPPIIISNADLSLVPLQIGDWKKTGNDVPPDKDVLNGWIIKPKNILERDYVNSQGKRVSLMLVYKGLDRRGWHLSEACFSGSGYNVTQSTTRIPFGGVEANAVKLVADEMQANTKLISIYWFARGNQAESNFARQQATMAFSRLNPPKNGWAFIRVTSVVDSSEEDTLSTIRDFIKSSSASLITSITTNQQRSDK